MDLKRGNRVRIESCDTKPQLNLQQATSLWVLASGRSIEVGHELALSLAETSLYFETNTRREQHC